MAEKTVTVGDTQVVVRETVGGFEVEEAADDFKQHLEDRHGGLGIEVVEADFKETKFSDADMVVRHTNDDFASRSQMQRLEDDERVRLTWVGQHGDDFEIGVADREREDSRLL